MLFVSFISAFGLWLYAWYLIHRNWWKINQLDNRVSELENCACEESTGHWRAVYQGDEIINYRCSECELGDTNGSTNLYGWDYCRRCGAKMKEVEDA